MKKNYTIGLDIGTSSVGWAVINNQNYKVIQKGTKKNNSRKSLWGVRLFSDAETAESRRLSRGTRRRYDRRRKRIKLLQAEFMSEINIIDADFFIKMKESFYNSEDKINKTIKISDDERKAVSEYNKKYPTIYHLRNDLISKKEKFDIRLVYLAIHHIIKYRGNFLYSNENFSASNLDIKNQLKLIFEGFYEICEEIEFLEEYINLIDYDKLEEALLSVSKNDKKVLTTELLKSYLPKSTYTELVKSLIGYKFSAAKIFCLETDNDVELYFKGNSYDEKYDEIEKLLDKKIEVFDLIKELYDMIFLKELFKGRESTSLSSLMVDRYLVHHDDLGFLKQMVKYDQKMYKDIFKSSKDQTKICLYEQYISNEINYNEFSKKLLLSLEKVVLKISDEKLLKEYHENIKRISNGDFLPRITDSDNGKYPYQLNKDELVSIIENQSIYYPFLKDKVENKYKLVKLLEFRIPYYVGPLINENTKNNNAWIIRKTNEVITPYNFNNVVDLESSAEKFITRMLSNCTYLINEKAIASNSILYSKFKVINELKQIKVNNERLTVDFQKKIFNDFFIKTSGNLTDKKFKQYLNISDEMTMYRGMELDVKGYSAENKFANNMSSYIDFFGVDGIFDGTNYNIESADEIITWITIFEDKKILESKIRNNYTELSDSAIKKALSRKYKGWSNLSEKVLTGIYIEDKTNGIRKNILTLMEETDKNFMQIINDKEYSFQKLFDKENIIKRSNNISYDLVKDLATSPKTKRGIYQALKVVDELVKYIGYEPTNISIEMSRGEEEKKRTNTRKKYLTKLYESCKSTIENYKQLKHKLDDKEEKDFNNQKLFLYFIQEGKSLYSGTPLNIEDLESYEIDHIIPRTLIKDDSLDNKALVLREENQAKAANFVLPSNYRNSEQIRWWSRLRDNKLISIKKYNSLCRKEFKDDAIEGFINRQLVETRQITKHVANILNNFYKNTEIIYLSANLSHNYRDKFEFYKFRDINDYHHAHDAYLAAIIGLYRINYLKEVDFERLKEINKELISKKNYDQLGYGYVINSMDISQSDEKTGEITFDSDYYHKTIENTLYRNDIFISKKTEIKTGAFYDETKSKKGNKGVPLKENLPTSIYGSYTSLNPAYVCIVKYIKKGKENQKMIGIPIYVDIKVRKDKNIKINYVKKLLELSDTDEVIIIKDKIPFFTLLNWNGKICSLTGATAKVEICNAKQFSIEKENMLKWKKILNKVLNKRKEKDLNGIVYANQLEEIIKYIVYKIEKEYRLYSNLIEDMRIMFKINNMVELGIEEKEKIIIEIFKLLNFNSRNANFKFLNNSFSSAFGKKNDRIIEHAKIINQSITGLKESIYEF